MDAGFGEEFLGLRWKAKSKKEKNKYFGLKMFSNFWSQKDLMKRVKKTNHRLEGNICSHISDKGLISRIY